MIGSRSISLTLAVAYGLWLATLATFALALHVYADGGGRIAVIIAEGACILSAVAATANLKHYSESVCEVIRDRDQLADDVRRLSRVR